MRSKLNLALTMLVAVLALCSFAPQSRAANEGDWTPTYKAQWWWKYVRTATALQVVAVDVTQVRSDRAGYVANKVVFVVVNNSRIDYKGGDLYTMGHMFADGLTNPTQGPAVFKPSDMTRGFLPAVQAGQSITIGMIAYTPEKGSFDNYARLAVGQ